MPPPPAPSSITNVPPQPTTAAPELSLTFGKGPIRGTSAPSSPAKSRESLLQRVQSLTGAARDQGASIIGAAVQSATRPSINKDKYFTLLVLDDQNTDWSKYFRGKRLHSDYDIRVEQAEFKEISITSSGESGPQVSIAVTRGGTKVSRSFRPDFVLIRQPPRNGANDFRACLLALKFGGVASINSLHSVYQFQDKPWVFAHLLQLQRRLGKDAFPLIPKTFFPNTKDLYSWSKFPCVLKAGHCHGGLATARLESQGSLQDATGLITGTVSGDSLCYCTLEPYVDAKYDIHIQKIGNNYKAFMRKSISGNWKTNQGSAMLEQLQMTEKYKMWIDEVSELFGGMEICEISVIVSKTGKEYILGASDSTFCLMGDTQEEDRRQIADLVVSRMQNVCRPSTKVPGKSLTSSQSSSPTEETASSVSSTVSRPLPTGAPPPIPERTSPAVGSIGRLSSRSSVSEPAIEESEKNTPINTTAANRRDSQSSQASVMSSGSKTSIRPQTQSSVVEDAEDTMKNLRKTFAGIFGDM
ncbi:synapsin [Condylostylus longicornis]|uniref:synapsin n=1 Tax=Condylostylus longicornis TaxID=2530218 RepID=UPI00244DC594|nr:synapsin [Condylostylus longicornis]